MSNHSKDVQHAIGQPEPRGSRPATKVVSIKVVLPGREVDVPIEDVVEMAIVSPSGIPFPTVARREADGKITRYLGFPLILVDEVSVIEVPTS